MRPREHLIYGAAASAALYPALGHNSLYFFAGSVAIDIDHYFDFVWHNGFTDFSFRKMFAYHGEMARMWGREDFLSIEAFHTVEFIAPLFIASRLWASPVLTAVLLGMVFHIALDTAYLCRLKILMKRSHSFVEYFIRKRVLEGRGLRPVDVYDAALRALKEN